MARPFYAFLALGICDSEPPSPEILFSFLAPGYELPQNIIDYCFPEALVKSRKTEGQITVFYPSRSRNNKERGYVSKFMPPNASAPRFPICFCFLTEIDWLSLFNQCSSTLQQAFITKKQFLYSANCAPTDLPKNCGKFLLPFVSALYNTPISAPGKIYEIFSLPTQGLNADEREKEKTFSLLKIQRPSVNNFGGVQSEVDSGIQALLQWMNIDDVVSAVAWQYNEGSILVSSSSPPVSSSLSISLTQLLTPFNWRFLIYPIAPVLILKKYFDYWELRNKGNISQKGDTSVDDNQKQDEGQQNSGNQVGGNNEFDSIYFADSPMDYLYSKYQSQQQINQNINNQKKKIQTIVAGILEENVGIIPKNFPHLFIDASDMPVSVSIVTNEKEPINKFIERIKSEKDSSPTSDFARFLIFRQYLSEKLVLMGKKQTLSDQQKQIQQQQRNPQQQQQQSKQQINVNSLSDLQQLFLEKPNYITQFLNHINLSVISNYGDFCTGNEKDKMKSTEDGQINESNQIEKEKQSYGGFDVHSFINSKPNKSNPSAGISISTAQYANALVTRGKYSFNNINEIDKSKTNNETLYFSDNFSASLFRSFIYPRAQLRITGLQGNQIQIDDFEFEMNKLNSKQGSNIGSNASQPYLAQSSYSQQQQQQQSQQTRSKQQNRSNVNEGDKESESTLDRMNKFFTPIAGKMQEKLKGFAAQLGLSGNETYEDQDFREQEYNQYGQQQQQIPQQRKNEINKTKSRSDIEGEWQYNVQKHESTQQGELPHWKFESDDKEEDFDFFPTESKQSNQIHSQSNSQQQIKSQPKIQINIKPTAQQSQQQQASSQSANASTNKTNKNVNPLLMQLNWSDNNEDNQQEKINGKTTVKKTEQINKTSSSQQFQQPTQSIKDDFFAGVEWNANTNSLKKDQQTKSNQNINKKEEQEEDEFNLLTIGKAAEPEKEINEKESEQQNIDTLKLEKEQKSKIEDKKEVEEEEDILQLFDKPKKIPKQASKSSNIGKSKIEDEINLIPIKSEQKPENETKQTSIKSSSEINKQDSSLSFLASTSEFKQHSPEQKIFNQFSSQQPQQQQSQSQSSQSQQQQPQLTAQQLSSFDSLFGSSFSFAPSASAYTAPSFTQESAQLSTQTSSGQQNQSTLPFAQPKSSQNITPFTSASQFSSSPFTQTTNSSFAANSTTSNKTKVDISGQSDILSLFK